MTDREEICELMSRYCWHVDHMEWDQWLDLFTPDASWVAGDFGPFVGREAMVKLTRSLDKLTRRELKRHFVANEIVEVTGDTGRLQLYVLVVGSAAQLLGTAGEYQITVAKADGRWRIKTLDFNRVLSMPPAPAPTA